MLNVLHKSVQVHDVEAPTVVILPDPTLLSRAPSRKCGSHPKSSTPGSLGNTWAMSNNGALHSCEALQIYAEMIHVLYVYSIKN